jgi:hypothetical protein
MHISCVCESTLGYAWYDLKQYLNHINDVLYYYLDVAALIAGAIVGATILIIAVVIAVIVMYTCKSLAYHKSSKYFYIQCSMIIIINLCN